MRLTRTRASLCALAICAVAAGPASAASAPTSKSKEARQDAAIKAHGKSIGGGTLAIKALRQAAASLAGALATDKSDISTLKTLSAALPGVLTTIGNGLTALKAAVTNLAVAQEYGVVQVYLGGSAPANAVPGALLVSSDIPDDANSAVVTGTMIVGVPATTPATPITLRAGVRSGESDGNGAADPVASAGIVTMEVVSPVGLPVTGGNTGLPTSVPITSKPNAGAGGAPVYAIPDKAPRSDVAPNPFAFPTDKTIDLTDAATLQNISGGGVNPFSVANPGATPALVVVKVTVRFNDLTASATDLTA